MRNIKNIFFRSPFHFDREQLAKTSGYAAYTAPFIIGQWPFARVHDELVEAFQKADKKLFPKLNNEGGC